MPFPLFALFPVLRGPTCHTGDVRRVLTEHLALVRRARGRSRKPPSAEDAPFEDAEPFPEKLGPEGEGEPEALRPGKVVALVAEAAMALDRQWQEEVLDSPPSRLMFGLCGVADRGVFLLEEAAPDLARSFERLRDLFMGHSQGGQPMSDDELGRAVDELEALIPAVAERFRDLHARRGSR